MNMQQVTIEYFQSLNNEDLHSFFWDMYKDVNNIRPRWVDPNDRDYMLSWIEYEISPERTAQRIAEWEQEAKWLEEQERRMNEEWAEDRAEREAWEWYELEERLCA
jgi:hypothetical protein